ncbi:uncharacterized protein BO80DRAFT_433446 [Aspergillus ibericus CBS 121593]|uniref:CBM-cenC domain-containing protein n=1 Tax=Aspergillus ibericus CBS 121593 TaxID=1448316 RepID=A0A395H6Y9_9EURO|nr:hypothetical protein BO80DRAFT_433446 [Aspergillus ibericus CBS 121593]RAL02638.1 hypothetical protein BO80DRAFT_433446 [Aspergillus ibericus CBS 121593]
MSSCNILTNPSFESGSLSPWYTNTPNAARVTTSTPAYSGTHTLALSTNTTTTPSISQTLTNLTRSTTYDFSIQVLIPSTLGISSCSVSAYTGTNTSSGAIVSEDVDASGEWVAVRGEYRARWTSDVLTVGVGGCEGGNGEGEVFMDEVVFGRGC